MKYLYDIAILRPIIILLVVVYHVFAMYAGIWEPLEGLQSVPVYLWICKFAQGFHIEGMAFVAGYVFAFQSLNLNKRELFKSFTLKKAKRLFIPSIVFGCLYYFLFLYQSSNFQPIGFIVSLLSGVAHMWFLPMLFWCFMLLWLIDRYHLSSKWLLGVLALVSIVPIPDIPLGLGTVNHFVFYTYLGYWLYEHQSTYTAQCSRWTVTTVLWIVFVVLCATDILLFGSTMGVGAEEPLVNRLLLYLVRGALKLGFATSGILALYNTVELVLPRVSDAAKAKWKQVSEISFGVYLCHQFILIALYRHSMLFEAVGSYWMPWIGLLVALIGSVIITYFAIKTKVGAFLMK